MGIPIFAPYHSENLMQSFRKDGWYLKSFPLFHGEDTPNAGTYLISPEGHKLVYATDFQRIDYVFKKLGINTFLIECNHMDDIDKELNEGKWEHAVRDHSSLSVVCEFLRVNKTEDLRNVVLCHLSADNSDKASMKAAVQEIVGDAVSVYIAERGLEIEL